MLTHFQPVSGNSKTGPMPVTTTSGDTCPPSCPLSQGGCYAKGGPLGMHWRKINDGDKRAITFDALLAKIRALPERTLWRHNQAGDLPGAGDYIDTRALRALVEANTGRYGFTYTHKPPTGTNARAIAEANTGGFTINLSANNLAHADQLAGLAIGPVVVVLPAPTDKTARIPNVKTPDGRTVVVCPATQPASTVTCSSCGLCQRVDRPTIVGFPAHGASKKKAGQIAQGVA